MDDSTFQPIIDTQLLSNYGWWQFVVCLFAFIALMAIWWHIGRRQKDFGQVWLALSVLCWSISGGVEIYYAAKFKQQSQPFQQELSSLIHEESLSNEILTTKLAKIQTLFQGSQEYQLQKSNIMGGWRSILSLFNSLFILLALPWFRYIPKRIEPIIQSRYWHYIIGLPFLFSLLPTISKMVSGTTYALISELDVYYAILTLGFLGFVLWESFAKRRLTILAWLSLACILITFVAQLYKLEASDTDLTLFSSIFKTSLIMIFFALALSWVKELSENVIPSADRLFVRLEQKKNEQGKFENIVQLQGIPEKNNQFIQLTPALYELLLKFASRRKETPEGWLEIKPKGDNRSTKEYDIRDYNEVKRLLTALLDGLFGKGAWTKNHHELPLKNALFEISEKRERKIRLNLPAEHIELSSG
ncbi:MAG: hypothetical protein DHS20C18_01860 [Saprospiraceae bacterium]|nr:MAG: hypothetical protein DHS20C18_01860 [Saprospiraceae bacterium]